MNTFRSWRGPALVLAIAAILVSFGYFYLRPRFDTPGKLISLLPKSDAVLLYADLETLRASGVLKRIEGTKSVEEPDYQRFIADTGFSYDRDLDALGVAILPNQLFAVLRGRFDWARLRRSSVQQGGSCRDKYCQVPTGRSGQLLSFFPIQSTVMGLAISSDASAAYNLLPRRGAPVTETPPYPAWVQLPKRALNNPDAMSPALQVFARALSSASQVTVGVTRGSGTAGKNEFVIELRAHCDSEPQARAVRDHLAQLTQLIASLDTQNGAQPDQGLSSLLKSGSVQAASSEVKGTWQLPDAFIDSLLR